MAISVGVSLENIRRAELEGAEIVISEHDVPIGSHSRSCSVKLIMKREEIVGLSFSDIENLCVDRTESFLEMILDHLRFGRVHREKER